MGGLLLAVDHAEVPRAQHADQVHQRDLGGVRLAREHRFAEEHAPERHAVEAAHEVAVPPRLDRMREAAARAARM